MLLARYAAISSRASRAAAPWSHQLARPSISWPVALRSPLLASTVSVQTSFSTSSSLQYGNAAGVKRGAGARVPAKVQALAFQLTPTRARAFARRYATTEFAQPGVSKGFIKVLARIIAFLLKYSFGRPRWSNKLESSARLDRLEAVYLPYWIVDASVKVGVKGSHVGQPAVASFVTLRARMPGFDWQPLRSLPLPVPSEDASYEPFTEDHLDTPARAHHKKHQGKSASSERYGPEDEMSFSKVPMKASLVPFSVSPLGLPTLFKDAKIASRTISITDKIHVLDDVTWATSLEDLTARFLQALHATPDAPASRVTFQADALQVDMLAAYPVLVPVYMARFKPNIDADGDELPALMVVVEAWSVDDHVKERAVFACGCEVEPSPPAAFMPVSPWAGQGEAELAVQLSGLPYFDPSLPVPLSKVPTEADLERDGVPEQIRPDKSPRPGESNMQTLQRLAETRARCAQIEDQIRRGLVEGQVNGLLNAWVCEADWTGLHAYEREAAQRRVQNASGSSEDAANGLGDHVDRADVRLQRYTQEQVEENRAYLEASLALQRVQSGDGADFGDEPITLAEAQENRRESKPDWLRALSRQEMARQAIKSKPVDARSARPMPPSPKNKKKGKR